MKFISVVFILFTIVVTNCFLSKAQGEVYKSFHAQIIKDIISLIT